MDSTDHPLQIKKKPIDDIFQLLKDLRSDIAQIRRDMVLIKNEIQKVNDKEKEIIVESAPGHRGWFY